MIRGYQTDNLADPTAMAACAKHFAGYGFSEAGKDYNTTWLPLPCSRMWCCRRSRPPPEPGWPHS